MGKKDTVLDDQLSMFAPGRYFVFHVSADFGGQHRRIYKEHTDLLDLVGVWKRESPSNFVLVTTYTREELILIFDDLAKRSTHFTLFGDDGSSCFDPHRRQWLQHE